MTSSKAVSRAHCSFLQTPYTPDTHLFMLRYDDLSASPTEGDGKDGGHKGLIVFLFHYPVRFTLVKWPNKLTSVNGCHSFINCLSM